MKLRFVLFLFPSLLVLCGCETKATARADARAAYMAGRAAELRRMQEEGRTSVRVIGHVKNSEIAWENGTTLAALLLVAEYQGQGMPREIFIDRNGIRFPVNMEAFLKGHDVVLEPGDTVELNP